MHFRLFIYNCKDFSDCLSHIRLLSWILIGSLSYTTMQNRPCLPLSQDVSCQIADHVNVIMTGFAEESKSSVIHMSSLFHAFVLCQVKMNNYTNNNILYETRTSKTTDQNILFISCGQFIWNKQLNKW